MSYYTLIEEERAVKVSYRGPVGLPALPERVADWAFIVMLIFVGLVATAMLVLSQAFDDSDRKKLKSMEEIEEQVHEDDEAERKSLKKGDTLSLVNYIFYRKLQISAYSEQVLSATPEGDDMSRRTVCCQMFRLFMTRVHPLVSIFSHFDISLPRADRAVVFLTRLNICTILCHQLLSKYRVTPWSQGTE